MHQRRGQPMLPQPFLTYLFLSPALKSIVRRNEYRSEYRSKYCSVFRKLPLLHSLLYSLLVFSCFLYITVLYQSTKRAFLSKKERKKREKRSKPFDAFEFELGSSI